MRVLKGLATRFGFLVIEDASHAIGAKYSGSYVGNCTYSDVTVFSFHPVKIITTGEGGMITTNSKILFERLRLLRSHGITRDKSLYELRDNGSGDWYYEQQLLGYNYRLTDIQCALGLSQLRKLDQFVERRNNLATKYNLLLKGLPIFTQSLLPEVKSSYHLYVILLDLDKVDKSRDMIFNELRLGGIGVNVHYMPIYRQPFYRKLGFNKVDYPGAEFYFERCITLPLYPSLSEEVVELVAKSLKAAIGG
jgi:dTDP-4-amino-4,6-dideoxygalactose transaminase